MRVAIFSSGPDVLVDIQTRLDTIGFEVEWLDAEIFNQSLYKIRGCDAVIVDEVDWEFRHHMSIANLEEWLLSEEEWASDERNEPVRLFLVSGQDRHLDRYASPRGNILVHHWGQSLDDALRALAELCRQRASRDRDSAVLV